MNVKIWIICFYLMFIYWISRHIPDVRAIFFPTLGAFSYLFISRAFSVKEFGKMIAGAAVASLVSSALFLSHTGLLSLLLASLFAILIIRKFHLNAPPVLAIALIPYFAEPAQVWTFPLAVLASLGGLLLLLSIAEVAQVVVLRSDLRLLKKKGQSMESGNS
ncbi:hypothetical protein SK3146_05181 [Paenibacillus konkukensis]|uniref:HPP family protein n=1 Tax=Paenibacillus konkukensis TaxID=2020716 RepID=A0ABY4RTH8_9BACL|nr:hypothetical protein [Paenibacillus konkukensis]UQZ85891.1 hypothetical protein SK3146_05181 [Paenibacillus konkukensis]